MTIAKRWAGRAFGTNTGNVFITLEGDDSALTGTLRMNEPGVAIAIYAVQGSFEGASLKLSGQPQVEIEGLEFGALTVVGKMDGKGEIRGDWETTVGSAGTFVLFPHGDGEQSDEAQRIEQFHVARHHFGAIEINRSQFTEIAESIRNDFPTVIVTVVAGTEQARYLDDFKQLQFSADRAEIIKIFAQKPDWFGANNVVSVEFGPGANTAMTQGANEAWVLGRLETLKRDLKRYERSYVTNIKRWGVGVNQVLLLGGIVVLPSLSTLRDRAVLMGAVLALIVAVNWLHSRYVPFAAIYLGEKKTGMLGRIWPSFTSWAIGIIATILATIVAAYLQGYLKIPSPPSAQSAVEAKKQ